MTTNTYSAPRSRPLLISPCRREIAAVKDTNSVSIISHSIGEWLIFSPARASSAFSPICPSKKKRSSLAKKMSFPSVISPALYSESLRKKMTLFIRMKTGTSSRARTRAAIAPLRSLAVRLSR